MPKLDLDAIPQTNATGYPAPFDQAVQGRWYRRLAPATGLSDFAASHVVLKPGAMSSQRHWHDGEDEMVIMIAGEAVLIEDDGRYPMRPGDIAVWPKGSTNGHHLVNESGADCVLVALGGGAKYDIGGGYSDIDMLFTPDGYFHKDGTPYPAKRIP
ncbi:cupin domain-containing protein [Sphingopyxis sp. PET50]|uniref:cupin domain-containing protein n=1 Tax=Sphingopyxis sp. PET50 TaxID=2976533 RepID=UPI0021AFD3D5|nr:cupin domain-containing protein [Sphingopyxis sp. PET50]